MFRSIFENAPIGVLILDNGGKVKSCNLMALSILSCKDKKVMGKKISEVLTSISMVNGLPVQAIIPGGDDSILNIKSEDGSQKFYEIQLSLPIILHRKTQYFVTLIDVTRRVHALQSVEDQAHRWDLALQGSQIGVFESDLRTGSGFASQTWFDLLGLSKIKGRDSDAEWHARVHPDDLALVVSSDAQCIEGLTEKSEATFRMKVQDDTWHWMKSILRVTERDSVGKAVRLLGTMVDITEQKRVDELKDDFVATVSHELRTPLAAVYGALGLLRGTIGSTASEKTKKLFGMAYRNTTRLIQVVDELLDFQKLKTGHFSVEISRVDIVDIVKQVSIDNDSYANLFKVNLKVNTQSQKLFVDADPLRLKQVITNLISNAAKFSFADGLVSLNVTSDEDSCVISIIDNGYGISKEFSKRVFLPFSQQADHLTRNKGGSGLGLAISKNLIEIMSGEIGFSSKPNIETVFWIKLPLACEVYSESCESRI
jgi:signal transduction histidine kinase